jgi:hypothetical protein
MKKAKVLGYLVTKEHKDANPDDWDDHDTGHIKNTFYVDLEGEIYSFSNIEEYGSCYSGYTSASWGSTDNILERKEGVPKDLIKPTKEIFINVAENRNVQVSKAEGRPYDGITTEVKTTDGEVLCWDTDDGGCGYYSSGVAEVNETLFGKVEEEVQS